MGEVLVYANASLDGCAAGPGVTAETPMGTVTHLRYGVPGGSRR